MKAICTSSGKFRGKIPDRETYCAVLNGERDWKPHVKSKLETVEIPYSLFVYLMELDRVSVNVHVDGKEEAARELIAIIEQRLSNNANKRRGTGSEFWFGIYEGREEAYKDIKEIVEQKYLEVHDES